MEKLTEFSLKGKELIQKLNELFLEYEIPNPEKNVSFLFVNGNLKCALKKDVIKFLMLDEYKEPRKLEGYKEREIDANVNYGLAVDAPVLIG